MLVQFIVLAFAGLSYASAPGLYLKRTIHGVATFNDFSSQSTTVCGPKAGISGTYGAAAGDISPHISGGLCEGDIDTKNCNGEQPVYNYEGPSCPRNNCGICYKVTVTDYIGDKPAGAAAPGKSIMAQIIDACPATSAYNYCKSSIDPAQRCSSSTQNNIDIDRSAYAALTGLEFGSGPNVHVTVMRKCHLLKSELHGLPFCATDTFIILAWTCPGMVEQTHVQ
ncbi:hypothetical protein MMC09_002474 [Bachmanniomyces sp. S44760]|nr:hypothetical protein [Bachmanniomyces sp. S44760]